VSAGRRIQPELLLDRVDEAVAVRVLLGVGAARPPLSA
jgi:hypothetical protein